jgi:hypothetical protein
MASNAAEYRRYAQDWLGGSCCAAINGSGVACAQVADTFGIWHESG